MDNWQQSEAASTTKATKPPAKVDQFTQRQVVIFSKNWVFLWSFLFLGTSFLLPLPVHSKEEKGELLQELEIPSSSQTPPSESTKASPSPTTPLEKVEVIGESLKQIDVEGVTPTHVISRQQIEASGETSLEGLLRETVEIDGVAPGNVYEPNSGRSVLMGLHSAPVSRFTEWAAFYNGPWNLAVSSWSRHQHHPFECYRKS